MSTSLVRVPRNNTPLSYKILKCLKDSSRSHTHKLPWKTAGFSSIELSLKLRYPLMFFWLGDYFPLGKAYFHGLCQFQGGHLIPWFHVFHRSSRVEGVSPSTSTSSPPPYIFTSRLQASYMQGLGGIGDTHGCNFLHPDKCNELLQSAWSGPRVPGSDWLVKIDKDGTEPHHSK